MRDRKGAARDRGANPHATWAFLYWSVKGSPQGVNRRQRRQVGHRGGRVTEIDPLEFFTAYNDLETTEADVALRIERLLDWLRERVDDATVDKAYARALQSARRWRGRRPPSTYVEAKRRGEGIQRADHVRKLGVEGNVPPPPDWPVKERRPDGWPRRLSKDQFDSELDRQAGLRGRDAVWADHERLLRELHEPPAD